MVNTKEIVNKINNKSVSFDDIHHLEPLFDRIKNAKVVMLGEASHGTHEYYTWRAKISKVLVEEYDFNFIAVEGDWPDCYKLNRYIKGYEPNHFSADEILHNFHRWPTWMWANWETAAFAQWLQKYNHELPDKQKKGFYGLDVYSLWESMESIVQYLQKNNPDSLHYIEDALRCFEPFKKDEGQSYARASMFVPKLCQDKVINLLKELRINSKQYDGDYEGAFSNEQNAIIAVNAEAYYRAMVEGVNKTWNLRDSHMADTLQRLLNFHGEDAKAIIWAHNTHIGDARATDMAGNGMYNIGELARKQYGEENTALVGFGSYTGTVMAGKSWGAPMQIMEVPEAEKNSWEYLLHTAGAENKLIITDNIKKDADFNRTFNHRAIGVVYDPAYEKFGNYVPSVIPYRYDAFLFLDETQALHPIHTKTGKHKVPETYPFGV